MEEPREPVDLVETFERHEAQEPEQFTGIGFSAKRLLIVLGIVFALVGLVLLPPLLNVNRYSRRIALSIGSSLGRPVRLDSVTLNLLPLPGFTLHNFVVSEDPVFGSEPVIRANSVRATLRIRSLWQRRVEFSRISLTEPSLNVVHLADGRVNLESILLQASRMPAAPTAQKDAGEAQRFPYIEATGGRVNLKLDGEKTPYSLVDAEFALWLPEPEHWRVRLEAHPARTDTAVSDTGLLRLQATLGRAVSLARLPVDLEAEWRAVPLGSLSLIALKRDAGMRGSLTINASVHGLVGDNTVESRMQLTGLRRADFVPVQTVEVDLKCAAHATQVFLSLNQVHCALPVEADRGREAGELTLAGAVPNTRSPEQAEWNLAVRRVPASALMNAWRMTSARVPMNVLIQGTLDGEISRENGDIIGLLALSKARIDRGELPLFTGDVRVHLADGAAVMDPVLLNLGGERPAALSGSFTRNGALLQMRGVVTRAGVLALAEAIPQFGDGILPILPIDAAPVSLTAHAARAWGTPQVWAQDGPAPAKARRHH